MLHKFHPELSYQWLTKRGMLSQLRCIFQDQKEIGQKHLCQLAKVQQKLHLGTVTGRHLFFKLLHEETQQRLARNLSKEERMQLLKESSMKWKTMPTQAKMTFEREAVDVKRQRQQQLLGKKEELQASLDLLQQRALLDDTREQCRLSSSLYLKTRLQQFEDIVELLKLQRLPEEVAAASQAPLPPQESFLQSLEEGEAQGLPARTSRATPGWAKCICRARDKFQAAILVHFSSQTTPSFYLLLHALKNPLVLRLQPLLREEPLPWSTLETGHDCMQWASSSWTCRWIALGDTVDSSMVGDDHLDAFEVHLNCHCLGERTWVTDTSAVQLRTLVKKKHMENEPRQRQRASQSEPSVALLTEHPWLQGWMASRAETSTSRSSGSQRPPAPRGPVVQGSDSDDLDGAELEANVAEAYSTLLQARRDMATDAVQAKGHFVFEVRGGKWTLANKAVAYDSISARPASKVQADWVKVHALPKMASWSTLKYSLQGAGKLAQAWIHKMDFLFMATTAHNMSISEACQAYEPEAGYLSWVATHASDLGCMDRVQAIRDIGSRGAASSST